MTELEESERSEASEVLEAGPTWPTDDSVRFGELVRKLRARTGLDQTYFGQRLDGYSKSLIGAIELGKRPPTPRFLAPLKREFPDAVDAIDAAAAPLLRARMARVRRPPSDDPVLPDLLDASRHDEEEAARSEPTAAAAPAPLHVSPDPPVFDSQLPDIDAHHETAAEPARDLFDARYAIELKLASGPRTEVYLAEDTILGRRVALLVFQGQAYDSEFRSLLLSVERKWSQFLDDGRARWLDMGEFEGEAFVVLAYEAATSLEKLTAVESEILRTKAEESQG